jgi:hypothetical protein
MFLAADVRTGRLDRGEIVFNWIDLLRTCCTRCQILLSSVVKEELHGFRCTNLWGMLNQTETFIHPCTKYHNKKCTSPNSSYSALENDIIIDPHNLTSLVIIIIYQTLNYHKY